MVSRCHEKSSGKDVIETILARRSVRAYTSEILGRKTVQTLLEAAIRAPTAMHGEPWAFVVVQNRQMLKLISDRAKPILAEEMRQHLARETSQSLEYLASPDFDLFHGAGTLIVICALPNSGFVAADCWLAAENVMLVACDLGLGSCVIGTSVTTLNLSLVKTELGIPGEYMAIAPIIVGMPREPAPATSRKEPLILSWKQ